ncbi:hypothetical protein FNV43_RR18401 [Rhamnella rubrinervis]|uniref:Uncharacterized protein n=1 Tax=Rhamnella rubrinervis TaxID=2594499 RepID=A0A8K0E3M4_9ROSA|nr:hypothetical protein FNV43_RR18401 [Rhamnella rubrinervis]
MTFNKEEMKSLGVFGIYKESYKIITSWSKIFLQIALAFILPTYLINFGNIQISNAVFANTTLNQNATTTITTFNQTQQYTVSGTALPYNPYPNLFSSQCVSFWLFQAACFIAGIIFSLFSTSAGIYTVARIHTGREVTFKKVMSAVPKVWKRLMVTFFCTFVAFAAYTMGTMLIIFIIVFITISANPSSIPGLITVLEDVRGFKAMKRARNYSRETCTVDRFGYGIVCSMLLIVLSLFGLVMETVLYFVCKSYHNENVDKLALSGHLDQVYVLGDYVPLKTADDVQLEKFNYV